MDSGEGKLASVYEEELDPTLGLPEPLTPREKKILVLMAQGHSNQEIAHELYISLSTVKTHVGRVLMKTNSRDRVHAVLFAFKHGLVDQQSLLHSGREER